MIGSKQLPSLFHEVFSPMNYEFTPIVNEAASFKFYPTAIGTFISFKKAMDIINALHPPDRKSERKVP